MRACRYRLKKELPLVFSVNRPLNGRSVQVSGLRHLDSLPASNGLARSEELALLLHLTRFGLDRRTLADCLGGSLGFRFYFADRCEVRTFGLPLAVPGFSASLLLPRSPEKDRCSDTSPRRPTDYLPSELQRFSGPTTRSVFLQYRPSAARDLDLNTHIREIISLHGYLRRWARVGATKTPAP